MIFFSFVGSYGITRDRLRQETFTPVPFERWEQLSQDQEVFHACHFRNHRLAGVYCQEEQVSHEERFYAMKTKDVADVHFPERERLDYFQEAGYNGKEGI